MGRHGRRFPLLLGLLLLAGAAVVMAVLYPRPSYVVPDRGGTYTEVVAGYPKSINPVLAPSDSIDSDLASLVFNGLTKIDERGAPSPDLATDWQVSTDNRSYTFALRQGVRWHDGAPFGPEDVVFTVKALQDAAFQGLPELAQLWRSVRVEVVDTRTVRFQLVDAYAPFLEFASIGILPAHVLKDVAAKDLPAHPFGMRPIGTGPFRVSSAARDEIVLEASPDFYGSQPFLTTLRFRFAGDQSKALGVLRRQDAQGLRSLGSDDLAAVQQMPTIQVQTTPDYSKLTMLLFNTRAALASEKTVRQAVSYAIDRRKLIDAVMDGRGAPADGPISSASWAFTGEANQPGSRPDAAKSLLDQTGWIPSEDGMRKRGDIALRVILLTNDNPVRVRMAEEIVRQLAAVGIGGEVQTAGWSGFLQDFLVPRKFQIALTEQWSPNFDPDLYQFWHSSQIAGGLNFASWTNRKADEVLENARRSADVQVRRGLYVDFQNVFAEEVPGVPLSYPLFNMAVDKSIRGVQLGPLVQSSDRFAHISDWYAKTKSVSGVPTVAP